MAASPRTRRADALSAAAARASLQPGTSTDVQSTPDTFRSRSASRQRSRAPARHALESLADPLTGAIADDDTQLIKFHGSYQQDDRDLREERRHQKLEPAYSFMIRTRTPGGVVTPAQWLELDAIARTYAERGRCASPRARRSSSTA